MFCPQPSGYDFKRHIITLKNQYHQLVPGYYIIYHPQGFTVIEHLMDKYRQVCHSGLCEHHGCHSTGRSEHVLHQHGWEQIVPQGTHSLHPSYKAAPLAQGPCWSSKKARGKWQNSNRSLYPGLNPNVHQNRHNEMRQCGPKGKMSSPPGPW